MSRAALLAIAYLFATAAIIGALGFTPATIAFPSIAFLALLADGIFRPQSSLLVETVTHGPRDRSAVALTFDDGPDARVTPHVLDALRAHGARATFFVIGKKLEANAALARRAIKEGHELGNHSFGHSRWLNFAGPAQMAEEIERGARAITELTGQSRPPLYRPPIGLKNPPLAKVARTKGLVVLTWSLHARDTGRTKDPAAIAARVLARIQPGDIVVLHDGSDREADRAATAAAVPVILAGLREKGLAAVTVSELLNI